MEWNYVVAPVFIMRFNDACLQLKHLVSDEWIDVSTDADLWHTLDEDTYPVSEAQALAMHEKFKEENVKSS